MELELIGPPLFLARAPTQAPLQNYVSAIQDVVLS